jgi:hypothetical protein
MISLDGPRGRNEYTSTNRGYFVFEAQPMLLILAVNTEISKDKLWY